MWTTPISRALRSSSRAHHRPWTVATSVGAGLHYGFELGAGVGLMLQRELGLPGAVTCWSVALPALATCAWRCPERWDRAFALVVGANLTAVGVHYTLWPSRCWPWQRCGLPILTSAEGLPEERLPVYNAILLCWGAATIGALVEMRRHASWAALGCLLAMPLRRDARQHFRWMRHQSRAHPAWWNRGVC